MKKILFLFLIIGLMGLIGLIGQDASATSYKSYIGAGDINFWDGVSRTFTRPISTGGTISLNKLGEVVDVLEAYGSGTSYTSTSLQAAITAVGATNKVALLLQPGTWTISANITTTANIALIVAPGAVLTESGAVTVTINGPFEAPLMQVFSGWESGDITFGSGYVGSIYPQWWNAKGDGSTDDTNAITYALNAGQVTELVGNQSTTYLIDGIIIPDGKTLKGQATLKLKSSATTHLISIQAAGGNNTKVIGLTLDGNKAGNTNKHCILFSGTGNYLDIFDTEIKDCSGDAINIVGSSTVNYFSIINNKISDPASNAIDIGANVTEVRILDNTIRRTAGTTAEAIKIVGTGGPTTYNIDIRNNHFYWTSDQDVISANTTEFVNITGNHIHQGNRGIFFTTVLDSNITGNNLQGNFASDVIELNDSDYIDVAGNNIYCSSGTPGGAGILLNVAPTKISINGNIIKECVDGIEAAGAGTPEGIQIVGNAINNMDNRGMNVDIASNNLTITGNVVTTIQKTGIWVGGGNNAVVTSNAVIDANLSNTASENGITVSNSIAGRIVRGNSFGGCLHPTAGVYEDVSRSFTTLDATPSVANGNIFKTANGGATTITTFDDGVSGEKYIILIGDGNTTIDFTGTNLEGNAGVDWSPGSGDWMECIYDGSNFYCSVHDTTP